MDKLYIFKTFPWGLCEVKLTPKVKLLGLSTMLNKMAMVSLNFDQKILGGKGAKGGIVTILMEKYIFWESLHFCR